MNGHKFLSLLLLILSSTFGFSQYTEVINSNRPGVSQSAFSVGTNVLQLEMGPYLVKEERTPTTSYEVDGFGVDFAARYGLFFEQLEINLEGTYQNDTQTVITNVIVENNRSNFKRFTIGAKYLFFDPYKKLIMDKPNLYSWKANNKFKWKYLIPAVAAYLGANFDTKDNPFTQNGIEGFSPRVMIATQNNLAGGWVFVTNFVLDRIGTDQQDFQYILTLTHSFHPKWALFAETQGISSDFYADNLFRFGGGYLWNKDFQLDTSVTFNTKDTPSVLNINFGMSYRFDFHIDKIVDNNTSINTKSYRKSRNKKDKQKKKVKDIDFDDNN